jgi:hypothetical protein
LFVLNARIVLLLDSESPIKRKKEKKITKRKEKKMEKAKLLAIASRSSPSFNRFFSSTTYAAAANSTFKVRLIITGSFHFKF